MLKLSGTLKSYCSSCLQPAKVGSFDVEGWPHKLLLCAVCLHGMAGEVERGGSASTVSNGEGR